VHRRRREDVRGVGVTPPSPSRVVPPNIAVAAGMVRPTTARGEEIVIPSIFLGTHERVCVLHLLEFEVFVVSVRGAAASASFFARRRRPPLLLLLIGVIPQA
jgi:hypothetical protein